MAVVPETTPARPAAAAHGIVVFASIPRSCAFSTSCAEMLPKGLYARALLIIITPIVVLEGVIAFAFMERHWQAVTRRLSEATARDIAAVDLKSTRTCRKLTALRKSSISPATASI